MEKSALSSFLDTHFFETNSAEDHEQCSVRRAESSKIQPSPRSSQKRVSKQSKNSRLQQCYLGTTFQTPLTNSLLTKQSKSRATRNFSTSGINKNVNIIICSLFENSNNISTKIGCCVINFDTGELIISEIIDSQIFIRTLHKIQVYEPTHIILPSSSLFPSSSKFATILKRNISDDVKIKEVPNKYFSSQTGLDIIKEFSILSDTSSSLNDELNEKYFSLSAVSGACWFIKNDLKQSVNGKDFNFQYFRINFENPEDTMLIDSKTIRALELIENKNEKCGNSFFKYLNNTHTQMGKRQLRNNILQPLTNKSNILLRINAVMELVNKEEIVTTLITNLKKIPDLDKLFSRLLLLGGTNIEAVQKINFILNFKKSLLTAQQVGKIIQEANIHSSLLEEIKKVLCNGTLGDTIHLVNEVINEDCMWANTNFELQKQRCYAIKSETNGLLKATREVYRNITNEILQDIKSLNDEYDLEIDYGFENKRGFFLRIKKTLETRVNNLPSVFINKFSKKNQIECSTIKLTKTNSRLKDIIVEIETISEQSIDILLKNIKSGNMSPLFMAAEAISMLDMLCSFAWSTLKGKYCRPEFSDIFHVKGARHPVLEKCITTFIPNNIVSLKDSSNFHIITGCNKSGKSVYLKQIALLSIMAQIGCPVPCQSATFPIFKKMHARVCNDTMEISSSNFAFEMKEIVYFLDSITSDTLLIMDELGRGSSVDQGFSIALAIIEYLLTIKSTVFVSTHFRDLPSFFKTKLPVVHLDMKSSLESNGKLKMTYQLCKESSKIQNYGILGVKDIFNSGIIEKAKEIVTLLSKSSHSLNITTSSNEEGQREHLNEMKIVNNAISVLSLILVQKQDLSSEDLRNVQKKLTENFSN